MSQHTFHNIYLILFVLLTKHVKVDCVDWNLGCINLSTALKKIFLDQIYIFREIIDILRSWIIRIYFFRKVAKTALVWKYKEAELLVVKKVKR